MDRTARPSGQASCAVPRLAGLDLLRGVAALAVVVLHARAIPGLEPWLPRAYLAVDLFVIMSGYVLAHAYGERLMLATGWREAARFVRARVKRLAPLAIAGGLLGLGVFLMRLALETGGVDPLPELLRAGALQLALVPKFWTGTVSGDQLFPMNAPLWTLVLELAVNIVWGVALARLSLRSLVLLTALCGGVLGLLAAGQASLDLGWRWDGFPAGAGRVTFGFLLGVLLHRLHVRAMLKGGAGQGSLAAWLVPAVALAVFASPVSGAGADLLLVAVLFPALLAASAGARITPRLARAGAWLGGLSFPVYAVHWPVLFAADAFAPQLAHGPAGVASLVCLCVVAALAVQRAVDAILRYLGRSAQRQGGRVRMATR